MTNFTRRFIIVVRADLAAAAHVATTQPELDPSGGDKVFTAPLSPTGDLPATAYWCSWAMTTAHAMAIRTRLRERGATVAEVAPVAVGGTPATSRFSVFDADLWDPEAVLATCGLKRIVQARP